MTWSLNPAVCRDHSLANGEVAIFGHSSVLDYNGFFLDLSTNGAILRGKCFPHKPGCVVGIHLRSLVRFINDYTDKACI